VNEVDFDPIQVEVWRHMLAEIAEEMGGTLQRTAYSPNIKERLDHSCAVFDSEGRLLAQAAHIPVHLGAMPLMMDALRNSVNWPPGVMWLCNDPRYGGTHLPDITLIAPVYEGQDLIGYVASRAHHADVGGLAPGSLPLSTEAFHEGLILSPVMLVENGALRNDILGLVCANSRTPLERRGDIAAQVAAIETGARRLLSLSVTYGRAEFLKRAAESIAYAEAMVRRTLFTLPPGTYRAEDVLDDDGAGAIDIPIRVAVSIDHDDVTNHAQIVFDFTGSALQVKGSLNATEAITRSACYYVVRCLVPDEIPTNAGCFAPITVIAPAGTIVNARFPAAVAGGNVETSQRMTDVILLALAKIVPERAPALSQGTMNNVTIGGHDEERHRPYAYYETSAGGAGASPQSDGLSGIHTHMTNTRNTPIEVLESHYPLRILTYSLAGGSGGAGAQRGGEGLVRRVQLLSGARVTLLTERRLHAPPGAQGGGDGRCGANTLLLPDGEEVQLPPKWSGDCPAGAVLTITTPGGGGWGRVQVDFTSKK